MREKNKFVREKWNVNVAAIVNMRDKSQLEREKERARGKRETLRKMKEIKEGRRRE